MAAVVTANQQQAGLASCFEQTDEMGFGNRGKNLASIEARKKAIECLTDEGHREEVTSDFELRGFIPYGEAFLLSLPDLATIERLLSGSEKRYNGAIKEIEKRMAVREAKVTKDWKAKPTEV
jgi:hypothetical protein